MALYSHENFGSVQRFIFMKGIITSVDSENDTAGVTISGKNDGSDIPLFYHCASDSEERSNGAIEGAASAFAVDDEVIVMYDVEDDVAVRIIGFVDGIKSCCSRLIFKAGDYYAAWNIGSGTVLLEATNDSEAYASFVPDPFTGNPRCNFSTFYSKTYVPSLVSWPQFCETTQEVTSSTISIECDSGSFVGEPVTDTMTTTINCSYTNEFGESVSNQTTVVSYTYSPFCDAGGNPNAGGTSSSSKESTWTKYYGYVFDFMAKVTDVNRQTAVITETGSSIDGVDAISYSIADPTGGGSYSDSYYIDGYGVYLVDENGEPISGNVATWIISKIDGVYAVYATNDPGATLNDRNEYDALTQNEDLETMLQELCTLGETTPSYIFG